MTFVGSQSLLFLEFLLKHDISKSHHVDLNNHYLEHTTNKDISKFLMCLCLPWEEDWGCFQQIKATHPDSSRSWNHCWSWDVDHRSISCLILSFFLPISILFPFQLSPSFLFRVRTISISPRSTSGRVSSAEISYSVFRSNGSL